MTSKPEEWKKDDDYNQDRMNQQPPPGMNAEGTGLVVISPDDPRLKALEKGEPSPEESDTED